MSPTWSRIKSLFHRIQDVPEAERDTWLDVECADDSGVHAQVQRLLEQQRAPAGVLADGALALLDRMGPIEPVDDPLGQHIGPYRLLERIGEGGMGQVFLAERDDGFAQRVALKRIRADFVNADLHARFLREREILARLIHPHIAQLHDGGVADDGTPYFTLEFVAGSPITTYCNEHRLDLKARVALLADACAAVAYAHRNLVVHRDLKPSNILVTADGDVKLLDFGIAKLIDVEPVAGSTATHVRLMTREYAAPEQILGEPITTATDVYVLGVLIYEVLGGRLPYPSAESGLTSWSTAIVERAPEALSHAPRRDVTSSAAPSADDIARARSSSPERLRRALRGDLERIAQRALAKAPDARYPSVAALADDLHAYLHGRALPGGSHRYRLGRFVRRHRTALALASALALAVIGGGLAVVIESRRTAVEAQRALRGLQSTAAVKDFLIGLFSGADPRANAGKEPSVHDLLDRGRVRNDHDLIGQPQLQAELEAALGGIYSRMGLFAQAVLLQQKAVDTFDASGDHGVLAASTRMELAATVRSNGDPDRARALLDQTIAQMQALPDMPARAFGRALYLRSFVAINEHHFDVALDYAERNERVARLHPDMPDIEGDALHARASAHWGQHAYGDAVDELTRSVARFVEAGPAYHLRADASRQTLAVVYQQTGEFSRALALTNAALANARKAMGERHPYVAQLLSSTGNSLYYLGDYGQARARLEAALSIQQDALADGSFYAAEPLEVLALVHAARGEWDDAERCAIQARDNFDKRYGPTHPHTLEARSDVAWIQLLRGNDEHGVDDLRHVLKARADTQNVDTAQDQLRLGEALRRRGETSEAVALGTLALAQAIEVHGDHSYLAAEAHRFLGLALATSGNADGGSRELRSAIAAFDAIAGDRDHPQAVAARVDLADLLRQHAATRAEATLVLQKALQQDERLWGVNDPRTRDVRQSFVRLAASR